MSEPDEERGAVYDEEGWIICAMNDVTGRRGIWYRATPPVPEARIPDGLRTIEMAGGREGSDAYVKLVVGRVVSEKTLADLHDVLARAADTLGGEEGVQRFLARMEPMPCGHKIEDLIGGTEPDGRPSVTKCGACLADRQPEIHAKNVARMKLYATCRALIQDGLGTREMREAMVVLDGKAPVARTTENATVHILRAGFGLCWLAGVPGAWPEGAKWVRQEEREQATCPGCRAEAQRPIERMVSALRMLGLCGTIGKNEACAYALHHDGPHDWEDEDHEDAHEAP